MSDPVIFVLVLVAGFFTGVLSGLFGVGGAVISTPAILLLGATPLQAVGSTLPSIIPSSISGTLRYARDGLVHRQVVLWTGGSGAAASAIGALASDQIPGRGHVQMMLTASLMGYTAWSTGRGTRSDGGPIGAPNFGRGRLLAIGGAAGILSGFLGVGGGIMMVPAFTALVRLPLKAAIGTSLACVGIIAIPGTAAHQLLGNLNWFYAIPLMITAIPGARVGAHFAINASERALRITVASILGVIAVAYGTVETLQLIG